MIIKEIRLKKGTNYCWLSLENGDYYKIHIDLILKNNLKLNNNISQEELDELLYQQDILNGINYGIRKLSYGKDSIYSFTKKLRSKGFTTAVIGVIVQKLIASNYLNDEKFVIDYVDYLRDRKNFGEIRILNELRKKGIDENIIREYIKDTNNYEEDLEAIIKIALRKLKLLKNKTLDKQKNSLLLFLKNKGYSYEIAQKVIDFVYANNSIL